MPEGHDATSARAALDIGMIQVHEMLHKEWFEKLKTELEILSILKRPVICDFMDKQIKSSKEQWWARNGFGALHFVQCLSPSAYSMSMGHAPGSVNIQA